MQCQTSCDAIDHSQIASARGEKSQTFSHYPALRSPADVPLVVLPEHPCAYLPGRIATDRAIWAESIPDEMYQRFMDAGFRRSGKLIYQPACRGCRACVPIRIRVPEFRPDKSQRRCARRNADLRVSHGPPQASREKFELYRRYVRQWHGHDDAEDSSAFEAFLYDSPLSTTLEFEYRDQSSALMAVGICDLCPGCLSSVYFYFEPSQARRGLGTFGALCEIEFAAQLGLPHYYLGYWVGGCRSMDYKKNFRPNELLGTDGVWRRGCFLHAADA